MLWDASRWLVLEVLESDSAWASEGRGLLREFPVLRKAEWALLEAHPCLTLVILPSAAFIRVVGSEFVQKYLGEGPRMVRDVFRLAKENAPAIIFIDEIDAIATKRFDAQTGGE